MNRRQLITVVAGVFLGTIFLVSGFGKLLSDSKSLEYVVFAVPDFAYSLLPYYEIVIGALILTGVFARIVSIGAFFLICVFMIYNISAIVNGLGTEPCGSCFGVYGSLSAYSALIMDTVMMVLVLVNIACYRGKFANLKPWFINEHNANARLSPAR